MEVLRVYREAGESAVKKRENGFGFAGGTSPTCIRTWGGILLLTD